jgi:hypothetical protein
VTYSFLNLQKQSYTTGKPIDDVIKAVEETLRILKEMGEETYWFSPTDTALDFRGLLQTLSLAKQRYGKEVRLKGE